MAVRRELYKLKPITFRLRSAAPAEIPGGTVDLVGGEVRAILRQMGGNPVDLKLARQVHTMQQKQFPQATVPELMTWIWLTGNNERFTFQGEVAGGRHRRWGLVPDFVVMRGGDALAWRIQGRYWHNLRYKTEIERGQEAAAKLRLLGATIDGVRIRKVVDLWEDRIYDSRPEVYEYALTGVELQ